MVSSAYYINSHGHEGCLIVCCDREKKKKKILLFIVFIFSMKNRLEENDFIRIIIPFLFFQIQCLDHQNKKQVFERRNMNIHHRMMRKNHHVIIKILNIQVRQLNSFPFFEFQHFANNFRYEGHGNFSLE
jgi:hypothetical protein